MRRLQESLALIIVPIGVVASPPYNGKDFVKKITAWLIRRPLTIDWSASRRCKRLLTGILRYGQSRSAEEAAQGSGDH